jgi:predicted RNA polymerase sigma factor
MRAGTTEAERAIERAARDSYGRLVAFLAARSRDVAAAEDALADAFRAALETWPRSGVPDKPEAWLLVAARRRMLDAARHARVHVDAVPTLLAVADEAQELAGAESVFPDERLKLLFICAHPAIDAAARTPLMLQVVLGLDAARIASAFVVQPAAMGQRLSRAKAKIRDARVAFEIPDTKELPARLGAVLEAIYAAYGSGWDDVTGADPRRSGLTAEAIDLGGLLERLLPGDPEVQGLLALMLYCESRRDARRSASGRYVPLSEQDVTRWSRPMIAQAERLLTTAREAGRIGRFQLEAAIQSVHAQRIATGLIDWEAIAILYEGLVEIAPTLGALVARAAAVSEARDTATGWALLQAIPDEAVASYQPYWALAAHLLALLGRRAEAADAFTRAIGLCEDAAMRGFLLERATELASTGR